MTYIYYARNEGPLGLWSFDSLPLSDDSGYGNDATYVGTPTTTRPIVAGGIAAQSLSSDDTINYPIDTVMIEGRETKAFSLEAWVKPQAGNVAVLARDNSGLFLDGMNVRLTLDFGTPVDIEYKHLNAGNVYHLVGVYDGNSASIYVNGQVMASSEIDTSVISSGFTDTTSDLKTTSSSSVVIDTPAVYNYALDSAAINRHYYKGIAYPEIVNLSLTNGGKYYLFYDGSASVYSTISFGDVDSWSAGLFDVSLAEVDSKLVNLYDEASGDYLGGSWTFQYSVDPDLAAGITLNGSRVTWESLDTVVVEYSTDDVTWTPISNGDSILGTFALTDGLGISIRVTLPTTTDQTYVDNLKLVFYTDKSVLGSDTALPATFVDPLTVTLADELLPPASFNDNIGVTLPASNGFSIPADTDFDPYTAVEMTVRFDTSTASKTVLSVGSASITTNGSGQWTFTGLTALYVDGAAVTSPATLAPGLWHHVVAVFPATTSIVYVGNDSGGTAGYPMRVGYLSLYTETLTAPMVDAIYDRWVGSPAIRVTDSSISEISESGYRGYAFDWSITGAG